MDLQAFVNEVQELSDLELAVLLSLIADQHCLLATDDGLVDDLAAELALVGSQNQKTSARSNTLPGRVRGIRLVVRGALYRRSSICRQVWGGHS